ncbi:Regulator of G-protein signaling rgs-7 [Toxocara canis]|uniref:Regulator of G-protein signaling rgs-7 n=2 Tax=Toxocara canis TaxID=6265 RepID=A0A0B2UZH8_TOXCA|nr:Regulator of G-protein signaling rgs-7 [Toxocara canis]
MMAKVTIAHSASAINVTHMAATRSPQNRWAKAIMLLRTARSFEQLINDESSRFTKTLSYIRNKMDAASTSTLYPTKEEVRQWEQSFESLLNHKYGCLLFRTFLKGEFSDENVDFWLECEEFKKMKEGKKATIQRAHTIYNEYIAEQSPKEVNLDSDTRTATKAALESGAKPNMFTLAQGRIEQLMAKDSYRRFLKSKMFLDLLNDGTNTTSSEGTLQAEIVSS